MSKDWDDSTELLRQDLAKIEIGWCQKVSSRESDGRKCEPWSPNAVAWCMTGALNAEGPWIPDPVWYSAWHRLYQSTSISYWGLAAWQDAQDRQKFEVIDVFKRAIAMEEPG